MSRRHDLDWVRVSAFGLLVLYHVGMYYVTWDWHVKSPAASPALEPFMLLTGPWRLALLFLVSGVASAYLLEKRSTRFLAERSRRLLVPLLFGMAVIVAPQAYYEVVEKLPGGYHDGFLAFYGRYLAADGSFCRGDDCLVLPTWNHLWFLAYLWVYTGLVWIALRVAGPAKVARARASLERRLAGAAAVVVPMLVLAGVRVLLVGRFEPTHALVDDWYNHAQYFPVFVLGFLLARAEAFWTALERYRWHAVSLAVPTCAALVWYFWWAGFSDANPPPELARYVQRVLWGVNEWAAIVAVLGFAYRFRNFDSRALRYLVPAVLPVYILHQTVIVVLAHNLQRFAIPPVIEGAFLLIATFVACFAGYEAVRRVPWLRPLFGLKRPTAAPLVLAASPCCAAPPRSR
ncbi:MAG TPA: acyltransferase family protein [Steroidobacteraceae bacterium]|nr:acyltransferase family protein [Steroidobacteraceae bacterium]